jgi:aminoglycoside 6'-N-acetyltransferase I
MPWHIVDLRPDASDVIEQTAALLHAAFRGRTEDWQDLESARDEVTASLAPDRISRVAIDDDGGSVLGWIGGIRTYGGRVWELHPLVVSRLHRRRGIGRALVHDLEREIAARGGLTLWLGSDDENHETTVSAVDLYEDVPGAIRHLAVVRGEHPCDFYRRLGFRVVGLMPDANGPGKPDIFFAKPVGGSGRRHG